MICFNVLSTLRFIKKSCSCCDNREERDKGNEHELCTEQENNEMNHLLSKKKSSSIMNLQKLRSNSISDYEN